jgi:hypothetical protein
VGVRFAHRKCTRRYERILDKPYFIKYFRGDSMADTKTIAKVKNCFKTEIKEERKTIFNLKWAELINAKENSKIYIPHICISDESILK